VPAGAAAAASACPNCGAARTPDDAFCEVCGLDFATGKLPAAPPTPTPVTPDPAAAVEAAATGPASGWTAVIEADREFFDSNQSDTPDALQFPQGVDPRHVDLAGDEVLIGRRSDAKGLFPAIDLGGPGGDPAVSHRHAVLRRQPDGSWAILDESSSNGTYLNDDPKPIEHGAPTMLHDGDQIHLGAFTTITVRRETGAR
jgi:hypothetical protein